MPLDRLFFFDKRIARGDDQHRWSYFAKSPRRGRRPLFFLSSPAPRDFEVCWVDGGRQAPCDCVISAFFGLAIGQGASSVPPLFLPPRSYRIFLVTKSRRGQMGPGPFEVPLFFSSHDALSAAAPFSPLAFSGGFATNATGFGPSSSRSFIPRVLPRNFLPFPLSPFPQRGRPSDLSEVGVIYAKTPFFRHRQQSRRSRPFSLFRLLSLVITRAQLHAAHAMRSPFFCDTRTLLDITRMTSTGRCFFFPFSRSLRSGTNRAHNPRQTRTGRGLPPFFFHSVRRVFIPGAVALFSFFPPPPGASSRNPSGDT